MTKRKPAKGVAEKAAGYEAGGRTLKIRAIGNSLGTVWPRDLLAKLGAKEGDELHVVDSPLGVIVLAASAERAKIFAAAERVLERERETLAAMAKR